MKVEEKIKNYLLTLKIALDSPTFQKIPSLCELLLNAWIKNKAVYLCGNGGSAGNAIHLANDFLYGVGVNNLRGINVEALSANSAVITCLANDIGYSEIFSQQLRVKANKGDVLIALSGSGNSKNILNAINGGNQIGMSTVAIIGFDGGLCNKLAQLPLHFEVNDMQISEDIQLIVGHICMQWLMCQKISNLMEGN